MAGLCARRKSKIGCICGNEPTSCEKSVRSHESAKKGRGDALRRMVGFRRAHASSKERRNTNWLTKALRGGSAA